MKKTKVILFIILIIISIGTIIYATTSDTKTVYVTDTGSKYHSLGCDEMTSKPKKTTVSTAEKYGYSPCKVCNPYGLATEFYGTTDNSSTGTFVIALGLFIIAFAYMIVPLVYKIKNTRWFTYKELNKFTITNSFVAFIILAIILTFSDGGIDFYELLSIAIYGVVFKFINYKLLEKKLIRSSKKIEGNDEISKENALDEELPMNWFNFWMYFRFPVGMVLTIASIIKLFGYHNTNSILGTYIVLSFFIEIIYLILLISTYYYFLKRYKIGYNLNLICMVVQSIINISYKIIEDAIINNYTFDLASFIGQFLIIGLIETVIWIIPNYIYFKKRKSYFNKDLDIN